MQIYYQLQTRRKAQDPNQKKGNIPDPGQERENIPGQNLLIERKEDQDGHLLDSPDEKGQGQEVKTETDRRLKELRINILMKKSVTNERIMKITWTLKKIAEREEYNSTGTMTQNKTGFALMDMEQMVQQRF